VSSGAVSQPLKNLVESALKTRTHSNHENMLFRFFFCSSEPIGDPPVSRVVLFLTIRARCGIFSSFAPFFESAVVVGGAVLLQVSSSGDVFPAGVQGRMAVPLPTERRKCSGVGVAWCFVRFLFTVTDLPGGLLV